MRIVLLKNLMVGLILGALAGTTLGILQPATPTAIVPSVSVPKKQPSSIPAHFGASSVGFNTLVTGLSVTNPTSTPIFSMTGKGVLIESIQIGTTTVTYSPPLEVPGTAFSLGITLPSGTYPYKIVVSSSSKSASTTGSIVIN
jgi:hypothetical protein